MNLHFAEFQGSTCACRPFRLSIVGKISPLSLRRFLCQLPRCNNRLALSGGCDDGYVRRRVRGAWSSAQDERPWKLSPSGPRLVGIRVAKGLGGYPPVRRSSMLLATSSQTAAKSSSSCLPKTFSGFQQVADTSPPR